MMPAPPQTCDPHLIINRGKFAQNGRAGYLLKPAYLLPSASPALPVDANAKATFAGDSSQMAGGVERTPPTALRVRVVSARNLPHPAQVR